MELKRILNRYIIGIMAVSFLFSWAMFYRAQTVPKKYYVEQKILNGTVSSAYYNPITVSNYYSDIIKKYNEALKTMTPQEARTSALKELTPLRKTGETNVVVAFDMFNEKYDYVNNFENNIEESLNTAQKHISEGFFEPGTSVYMNILKTRYDLMQYDNVKVKVDNGQAFMAVMSEKISHFMLLVIIVAVAYQFIIERRKGLWELIHTSFHGRLVLSVKRFLTLGLLSLMSCIIMYLGLAVIAFWLYGGLGDIFDSIQCEPDFFISEFTVSKFVYLLMYIMFSVISVWTIGCVVWTVLSVFDNQTFAAVAVASIGVLEYVLYVTVSYKSRWNLLKHFNIFKFILPSEIFLEYMNWGIGENIWSHYTSTYILMIVISVIALIFAILVNTFKRPVRKKSALTKSLEIIQGKISYITSGLPLIFKELKKCIIIQKGMFVIIIAMLITVSSRVKYGENISDEDSITNEFYKKADGLPLSDELYGVRDNFESKMKNIEVRLKNTEEGSADESYLKEKYNFYKKVTDCADENISSLENLKAKGIDAKVIKPYKLREFLGKRLESLYERLDLIAVFAVILLSFSVYSYENKQGTTRVIRSSKRGRKHFFWLKCVTLFVQVLIIWTLIYGYSWYNIKNVYNFTGLDWCIQGYLPMKDFPIEMTVGQYIFLLMLIRLTVMFCVAMMCFLISVYLSYNNSFIVSVALLVPHIISIIAIKKLGVLSIVKPMDFARRYNVAGNSVMSIVPVAVMIVLMLVSLFVSRRKCINV